MPSRVSISSSLIKSEPSKSGNIKAVTKKGGTGTNNVTVSDSGKNKTINIDSVKQIVTDLKPHHTKIRDDLPQDLRSKIDSFEESVRLLKGDSTVYPSIISHIKTVYNDVKNVKPRTVGAYFYGCFSGNVPKGEKLSCTAVCSGSVQPHKTLGWSECDKTVATYSEAGLDITSAAGEEAIIHVTSSKFTGFNEKEEATLKKAGVKKATVKLCKNNSNEIEVLYENTNIDDLCTSRDFSSSKSSSTSKSSSSSSLTEVSHHTRVSEDEECEESSIVMFIVAFVIILIILAIVAYGLMYYYNGTGSDSSCAPVKTDEVIQSTTTTYYGPGLGVV